MKNGRVKQAPAQQSMARCRRRSLLCLCLPFLLLGNLFIYITVSICNSIAPSPIHRTKHFIAPGVSNSVSLAPHPLSPFWNLRPDGGALWNSLQIKWDRKYNPILTGIRAWRKDSEENMFRSSVDTNCTQDHSLMSHHQNFTTFPEQLQQFVLSMHCREYPLLLNQAQTCGQEGQEEPLLLMVIKSQVGNFENRQAIRQTWGRDGFVKGLQGKGGIVRRLFLLGKQDASTGLYADLTDLFNLEKERYHDILQWDFQDTFFNLTLKDVLFWRWFSHRCPKAHFIFKGDDDVFVRTPALLDALQQEEQEAKLESKRKIMDFFVGDVIKNAVPLRQTSNKYYIPESFYKGKYPAYAGGGGVVYSGAMAFRLIKVSRRVHLFPIDDVYLGMCLQRLGVYPIHHRGFLTFDFAKKEAKKPCAYHSVFLVHKRNPKEILRLWEQLKVLQPDCENKTMSFHQTITAMKLTKAQGRH
ncbi:hypothetical protein JZ751_006786 [Albula glossodonta]|uniref:Hexosyltransferase n=1 Tax=Albula glossodonta TaxID=121402 RepID=A0A8T2P1N4_9TELE|nr:hypothetical protein JZ751_006786 [Albula glossodonta]